MKIENLLETGRNLNCSKSNSLQRDECEARSFLKIIKAKHSIFFLPQL